MTNTNDLSALKPTTDTITVPLTHPATGEPLTKPDGTQMSVTVHAPYSAPYKQASHDAANERISKMSSTKDLLKVTSEEVEAGSVKFLTKITKEFDLVLEGKPVKYSEDFVKKLYTEFVGIKDQVEAALEDTTNFMKH